MAEAFGQLAWEVMRRNHARERLLLAVLRRSSLRRVLVRSNAIDWSVTMKMVKFMQLSRLTLKTDERPPGHRKPPASKVFQR